MYVTNIRGHVRPAWLCRPYLCVREDRVNVVVRHFVVGVYILDTLDSRIGVGEVTEAFFNSNSGECAQSGDVILGPQTKILACERGSRKWKRGRDGLLGAVGHSAMRAACGVQGVTNRGLCWVMSSCGAMTTV